MMTRELTADKVHTEALSLQMIRRTTELTVNRVQMVQIPTGVDSRAAVQGENRVHGAVQKIQIVVKNMTIGQRVELRVQCSN